MNWFSIVVANLHRSPPTFDSPFLTFSKALCIMRCGSGIKHCFLNQFLFCFACFKESGCGGPANLQGRKGVIQSLGFPTAYPAHLHCSWKITVPRGLLVKLQITEMAITGETGQCKEDKLVISDKYSTLGEPRLNLLCRLFYSAITYF